MGTKGTAPQLRLTDVRRWRPGRAHRQAGRPQWHRYDRDRLPRADSARSSRGCRCYGPHLSGRQLAAVVTQLVTQCLEKATREDRKWPVSWVGVAGFEPAASSSRTKRAAK